MALTQPRPKLTLAGLTTLVASLIDTERIAIDQEDYLENIDSDEISGLIVKIGKLLMNDSVFADRLPELDGEEIPDGTTVEEYFIHLVTAEDYDGDGTTTLAPFRPEFGEPFYSQELGRKTIPITVDDTKYQHAMLSDRHFQGFMAILLKRLYDSYELFKYSAKKQLLGDFISRIPANSDTATMIKQTSIPNDTTTGEAWIKEVKTSITELTKFNTETNNLAGVIARSPELVLYVKGSALIPEIDVGVLAGAFHKDKVQLPVRIVELEDFGDLTANEDTWAILFDPRGIRLHTHQVTSTNQYNAQGEFTNYFLHHTPIGYISNYTNVRIWTE